MQKHHFGQLYYFIFVFIFILTDCKKEVIESRNLAKEGPDFAIETNDSRIPYLINCTEGERIENEPKVPAVLRVYMDRVEIQKNTIGIEYRGSNAGRL